MKTLPKMEVNEDIDAQIAHAMDLTDLCKADVIRQALKIGLPQFAARFQPPRSGWKNASAKPWPNRWNP